MIELNKRSTIVILLDDDTLSKIKEIELQEGFDSKDKLNDYYNRTLERYINYSPKNIIHILKDFIASHVENQMISMEIPLDFITTSPNGVK